MKLLIVNNLNSGMGEGLIYDFIRAFQQDGDEVTLRSTAGGTDFASMLRDAANYDAVIASGGDGTVATVAYLLQGSGIPILPFPSGTANLTTLNLLIPTEAHQLANIVRSMHTLDFDLGEITANGRTSGFTMMAGTGFDAAIMKTAEKLKPLLGPFAYYQATMGNLIPKSARFTITIDGETIQREGLCALAVNFSKIHGGLSVTHRNMPRDGKLDFVVISGTTALDLIPAVGAALLDLEGEYPDRPDIMEFFKAEQIDITIDPPLGVQYDGEVLDETDHLQLRVLPGAARFIMAEDAYRMFTEDQAN